MSNQKKKVVFFGGGTGLSTLLSGIKDDPDINISAIVTMFDSGGSSGELHDQFGVLPSGDILRCIWALADEKKNPNVRDIFTRRIRSESIPHGLVVGPPTKAAHTFGNLMFMAMQEKFGVAAAVRILEEEFSLKGRVYPVSTEASNLTATFMDGSEALNEVEVDEGIRGGKVVSSVCLRPYVPATLEVLNAIFRADVICISAGSFWTSTIPPFLPHGVSAAIAQSAAPIVFVSNLMTEGFGMPPSDYTVELMARVLHVHLRRFPNKIIFNTQIPTPDLLSLYAQKGQYPVICEGDSGPVGSGRYVYAPLRTDGDELVRHDPKLLAEVLSKTFAELTASGESG